MILPQEGPEMTMKPVPADDEVAICGTVPLHVGATIDLPGSCIGKPASADESGESDKSG